LHNKNVGHPPQRDHAEGWLGATQTMPTATRGFSQSSTPTATPPTSTLRSHLRATAF
jgi:hypothetical protein